LAGNVLDIEYIKPDPLPVAFYKILHHNGLKRAIKSIVRRLFFDEGYYKTLESVSNRPLRRFQSRINFVVADPESCSLPLPSASFDLIVANAVLEHIKDITKFASEIYRLLVKDGYFYAIIHNFYSISGGHHLEWAYPDEKPSTTVPPWDHLRGNKFPSHVYLNKLKSDQYQAILRKYLNIKLFEGRDVNHDPNKFEGEKYLTSDIANELQEYPRELLLTRSWCVICQKKN
jgi:SAM-dependent methyltransferase